MDNCIKHSLDKEIQGKYPSIDTHNLILLQNKGPAHRSKRIKEISKRKQQTRLQHKKQLEAQFSRCFTNNCHLTSRHIKELLGLTGYKPTRLSKGNHGQYEASEQQTGNQVIACNGVRYGISRHSLPASAQFGMKQRALREKRFTIILRQTRITKTLPHRVPRQV